MKWGLLSGIGKGLSQGADMLQRGMSEDRAVELQKMRDASVERRWKADSARQDSQRSQDVAFRNSQADTSKSQFDRQQTSRDKQTIENNINGVMEQQNRAEQEIRNSFEKRMGIGGSQELENQLKAELEANQMYYSERLRDMINSYGDNLKGTGFEYLLTVKPEAPKGKYSDVDKNAESHSITDYVSKIMAESQKNAASLDNPLPAKNGLKQQSPGLIGGFLTSIGGQYNNNSQNLDYSTMSPAKKIATGTGKAVGGLIGTVIGDSIEYTYDKAIKPAYDWLTTAPAQSNKK